jgi:peroxiredoxin
VPASLESGKGELMFLTNRTPLLALFLMVLLGSAFASSFARTQNGAAGPVDFSLQTIDRQTITSDSLHGEVVVLAFGASWLPLSRAQLQGVRKLADEYSDRGVVVYWVSTESEDPKSKNFASNDQLRAFAQKYGLKVTVLRDPDGVVSKKFGIDQLPSIVILDKQGNASEPIGGLDPNGNLANQLASRLDKVL